MKVVEYLSKQNFPCKRPFIEYVIDKIHNDKENNPFFINAPTGYGKTFISMSVALNELTNGYKTIISYPLRSLIEDQKFKINSFMDWIGKRDVVGCRYMGDATSIYLVYPITLTTIDTLSLTALGISPEDTKSIFNELMGTNYGSLGHYIFSWASVYTSTIILDEVHLLYDSSKSLSFLISLLKISRELGNRLIFMSATIPDKFIQKLKKYHKNVIYEKFNKNIDPTFYEERKEKNYEIKLESYTSEEKLENIKNIIENDEKKFNRALIVFNTIEDAIKLYSMIKGNKILIHSRFSIKDREEKLKLIEKLSCQNKLIVIGTQAIEAGVDFSSDLIISEIAPPNSLIQRFGRFLRKYEKNGKAYIWYEENILNDDKKLNYKVYDKQLITRTIKYLEQHKSINLHIDFENFLNEVYVDDPKVDEKLVDEIIYIMFDLREPTKSAFKLLLEMEGSFIRDGNIFTAVTEDNIEVPVNYNFLRNRCIDPLLNEKDAIIKALQGFKFRVKGKYDKEVGLV
ncbi:MAG: CRISPR-associated helicase Cas3' [Candidatus Methanomethylicia archaeon]